MILWIKYIYKSTQYYTVIVIFTVLPFPRQCSEAQASLAAFTMASPVKRSTDPTLTQRRPSGSENSWTTSMPKGPGRHGWLPVMCFHHKM